MVVTIFYQFNVLPFGLATAPFIFSKLVRVMVTYWRAKGHKVIMSLDDGLGGPSNINEAQQLSDFVRHSLKDFGFLTSQIVQWLGFEWHMESGTLHATASRMDRLMMALNSLVYQIQRDVCKLVPARFLASVVGQIISLAHCIGSTVRLKTRALYRCIDSRASWNAPVMVSDEALKEIEYWVNEVQILNDTGLSFESTNVADVDAFSDASAVGFGGYVSLCAGALAEGT